MSEIIFSCGHKDPVLEITFTVADSHKTYRVCFPCAQLDYFSKFIVKKKSLSILTH